MLIDRSGAVKLTDFGIARAAEIERRTDAGQLKGKLGYMSPEQVVGKELDARSDLFTPASSSPSSSCSVRSSPGRSEIDVLMRIRDADLGVIDRAGSRVPDDVKAILFRALAKDELLRYPNLEAARFDGDDLVKARGAVDGDGRVRHGAVRDHDRGSNSCHTGLAVMVGQKSQPRRCDPMLRRRTSRACHRRARWRRCRPCRPTRCCHRG